MRTIDADAMLARLEEWNTSNSTDKALYNFTLHRILEQPTIEPQRKKGKWIYGESEAGNDGYYCSKCGNFVPWKYDEYDIDFIKEFLFCNKCGAEMRNSVETARDIVHSG